MKTGVAIVVGVLVVGVLSYGTGALINRMIPKGQPVAKAPEPFNDPNDLTPRMPILKKGPHQDDFVNNCTACHSTRLTMTQPDFPEGKWKEVVKKMVTVYGAKIDQVQEDQIVKYLVAVKGTR